MTKKLIDAVTLFQIQISHTTEDLREVSCLAGKVPRKGTSLTSSFVFSSEGINQELPVVLIVVDVILAPSLSPTLEIGWVRGPAQINEIINL